MTDEPAILSRQSVDDLHDLRDDSPEDTFRLDESEAAAAVEALLFAAGDPLPVEKIQQITGLERPVLQNIITALADRMARDSCRGLLLREVEGRFFLCTKPAMKPVLQRLFQPRQRPPLSQAAYETLAIVAYNQPVTRAQVEAVRGVNSDSIINRLVERNLVTEAGHLETPGRPILYTTTEQFLLDFGLRSVKELPPMEMLMYGTLRDFELSLEAVTGQDRQITIDQLVQAYVPAEETAAATAGTADAAHRPEDEASGEDMPEDTVLAVSSALFGDADAPGERPDEQSPSAAQIGDEKAGPAAQEPDPVSDSGKSR